MVLYYNNDSSNGKEGTESRNMIISTHDWTGSKRSKEQIWIESNSIWDVFNMKYLERM